MVSLMFAIDQFPEEEKMYQSRAERSTQPCNSHQKGLSHIPAREALFTKNCKTKLTQNTMKTHFEMIL